MTVDELQIVSQSMFPVSRTSLEIFRDLVWVANCIYEAGQIAECYSVQLGDSGADSDEILAAISRAIQAGEKKVLWRGQIFTWKFKSPIGGQF